MTPHEIRDAAEAARAGCKVGIHTEVRGDVVLIGLDTPAQACLLEVARSQYDGDKVLQVLRIEPRTADAAEMAYIRGERRQAERRDPVPPMPGRIERRKEDRRA
jgi:hypothetical protein